MASLKEVKGRIGSVKGTLKITSAMKMVASAKLHKAQEVIEGMLPYEQQLSRIFTGFMSSGRMPDTPLINERPVKNIALVVCSSNNSLCGGFNANVVRMVNQWLQQHEDLGKDHIKIFAVGRKVAEAVRKAGYEVVGDYTHLADKPSYDEAAALAETLMQAFLQGEVDRVELIYHHFRSTASQTLEHAVFLPFVQPAVEETENENKEAEEEELADYIVEPSVPELLQQLLPSVLRTKIYTVVLDSSVSEHAARTMAMQVATDNANDLIQDLTIMYNKSRQQVITNELLDIMGGSMS